MPEDAFPEIFKMLLLPLYQEGGRVLWNGEAGKIRQENKERRPRYVAPHEKDAALRMVIGFERAGFTRGHRLLVIDERFGW